MTDKPTRRPSVRNRLVLAALDEVEEVGFQRFSVRNVARRAGVSCAAPYKHFKNKREIFEAILQHINEIWLARQDALLTKYADCSIRRRLVEMSLEYVRFMVENPRFRSILMIYDETFDPEYLQIKAKLSERSKELIREYCQEVGMPERTAKIKMYVVRSLIYGASLMFGNTELPYDDVHMKFVEAVIDREFDLP
ncbi:MAG: TetR/AcrR family transcriptional regulator [Thermoguttaceae bacterium]|nr:TetR/AcrR family transcriptional regulator [Thermoguttaceae bacterium]